MPLKNEIGNRYGKLLVIEYSGLNVRREAMWKCQCDCGKIAEISGTNLRRGHTKSCGCLINAERDNIIIDEIGNKYGSLTVLKRAGSDNYRHAQWECQCDCGNITIALGKDLRSGRKISCGCMQGANQESVVDETGNTYGRLKVIKQNKIGFGEWVCKCECGNTVIVSGTHLRLGYVKSCGCLQSIGEFTIIQLLNKNNIKYKTQYTFNDLKSKNDVLLRFDFAIFNNNTLSHLVEYDGIQHYDETKGWHTENLVDNDNKKNEYCKQHNIKLIRLRNYHNLTINDLIPKDNNEL